jgi:glycosyltransferase involved in cell wall biosynthesis
VGLADVALVHDYLTQRGGAERVVLSMHRAFPDAPLYVSLFDPRSTFREFADVDVRVSSLNRIRALRQRHRFALPVLAPTFSHYDVDARVVLCSSSGWAHGVSTTGRKVVYCHAPARWLYQASFYDAGLGPLARGGLALWQGSLKRWDRDAALSASRYLTNSTAVRARILHAYGIHAEVLHPPVTIDPAGARKRAAGIEPGFFLVVSRLLTYKNVAAVVAAFAHLSSRQQLVVVGTGPEEAALRRRATGNVRFLPTVDDDELRWLYASARGVIAAAYEDFGLTPLEAAQFGTPAAVLRFGGFLDTMIEGKTGVFFDRPEANDIRDAVERLAGEQLQAETLRAHAASFSEERFVGRLRKVVAEELASGRES